MSEGESGSTLPRRQLGRYLNEWREKVGLTLAEAAEPMQWSAATLMRLEKGRTERIRVVDIDALCRVYDVPSEVAEGLKDLAQQASVKSWWHAYSGLIPSKFDVFMSLEAAAHKLTSYQELVPGLLQTADYARVLTKAVFPDDTDAEIEGRVRLKMERQRLVTRKTRPTALNIVLHEAALRRVVGTPAVMSTQLKRLADAGTRDNVHIRVLPFTAGVPMGDMVGPFTILEFGEDRKGAPAEPTVVYVESYRGDMYLEKPIDVQTYHRTHESFQRVALDEMASKNLLRQVAKEYAL